MDKTSEKPNLYVMSRIVCGLHGLHISEDDVLLVRVLLLLGLSGVVGSGRVGGHAARAAAPLRNRAFLWEQRVQELLEN